MASVQKNVLQLLGLIAVVLLFYTFQRFLYFTWNNHFFSEASSSEIRRAFIWGLRFDLYSVFAMAVPSVILTALPIPKRYSNIYLKLQAVLFFVLQVPAYMLNQIDVEFSNFAGRRFTFANLSILEEASNKLTSYMITHGALIFAQLLILAALIIALVKTSQILREKTFPSTSLGSIALIVILFPLAALCIRGGLQRKPLSTAHANMFDSSALNNLMLNSTFTIIRGNSSHSLKELQYFVDKTSVKNYLNGSNSQKSVFTDNFAKNKTNVVVIILEGFALEYMGDVNNAKGFTPFLDDISEKGLFFKNSYANARRSIEAIPSITSGIPTLMADAFVKSPYFDNALVGMGTYFKRLGYETSFFHGGLPGTMYFDIYTKKAGYDNYYSAADYPNPRDSDGYWGIWDEEFLDFTQTKLKTTPRPFLATFFSLTSHHPYRVPARYEKTLPSGNLPILKTIAYTDMALNKFFEKIKDEPWYDNTLFVITADHTQVAYLDEYKNPLGRYRIPIIFYHPNYKFPKVDTYMITQQIDILPSLLDMFKVEGPQPLFGKSVFKPGSRYAVLLDDQNFYYRDANLCLVKKAKGDPKEFNCGKDVLFHAPTAIASDYNLAKKRLEATLQYFQNSMIYNEIYTY